MPSSYSDLKDFQVTVYTLNEILSEKIRCTMQRIKVRDYYDVWKLLGKNNLHSFDTTLIGKMVKQKCKINDMEYNPSKIFDAERLSILAGYWEKGLERVVVEELPKPEEVFRNMRDLLEFLPER